MTIVSWSAASAVVVTLCTLGATTGQACDDGCDCGYGGYGYGAAAYASPYPAYAYYAAPVYYQPVYAYYAPAPYYGYAAPGYGGAYYGAGGYGAAPYYPPYGGGSYLGAQFGHAPRIDKRGPISFAAAPPLRRQAHTTVWSSKAAGAPLPLRAKRAVGVVAVPGPKAGLKNFRPAPMPSPTPAAAVQVRRADAALTR